ncbi:sensor histidine kinase [Lachnoclostridium phytofermentans]|uniref:histidine kinase n=1 Tax=Lachnoclostridium phytofermentans (strain ATCC 700394 / DSM 18823 / ISDg) TaxID=357809 RepID=A9KKI8_LACP7|nr:sensor histidine kinase [Lachnoclostridium phytofermentans]ABX41159.1 integral membrane sensor signal transduction histidine kinase [Lachnoclostridium phytofermentans ISDg]
MELLKWRAKRTGDERKEREGTSKRGARNWIKHRGNLVSGLKECYENRPLFQQFATAFIALVFLPILCVTLFSYFNGSRKILQQYEEILLQATTDINDKLVGSMRELDWLTLQIANQEQTKNFVVQSPGNFYEKYKMKQWCDNQLFLKRILTDNKYVGRLSIIGDSGIEYSIYGDEAQEYDKNLYNHKAIIEKAYAYRDNLPADGRFVVFLSRLKENSQTVYLTAARRFPAGDYFSMKGSVIIEIQARMLGQIFSGINVRGGSVCVLNEDKDIIFHTDTKKIGKPGTEYLDMSLLSGTQGSFTVKRDGERVFTTYSADKLSGWISLIELPVGQMEDPIQNVRTILIYMLLIAVPLTLWLGYQFTKAILEPIHQLEWYMDQIGSGEWKKVIGYVPGNEIGTLMKQYNRMVDKIQELIKKVYKAELQQSQDNLEKRKAQLQALQTQINPHFLYNTLGAINTYAMEAEQPEIEQMIGALSSMFRYAVQDVLEPVQLADEVAHVNHYLTIMWYRHRIMPQIIWDVDSCMDQQILRLTIQPILENAFQHGFEGGVSEKDFIRIQARKEDDVIVEIEDSGNGIPEMEEGHIYRLSEVPGVKFGIGLINVNKRIQIVYGEAYGILLFRNVEGGTTIRLALPCLKHKVI